MIRKIGWVIAMVATFGMVSAGSGEALAARSGKHYSIDEMRHALRFVDELETKAQRMTAEALQMALDIEPEQSFANFKRSHDYFERVLSTLQTGDKALSLPAPTDPKLLEPLRRLQAVWDEVSGPVKKVLESGEVTRSDLTRLVELDNRLVEASRETEKAYEEVLQARVMFFSAALNNVVKAEHLSFLVEHITTEFLLIAYDHEASLHRQNLDKSTAEFELILNGLIHGDPDLHLVPAPNASVAAQLRKVELIWLEVAQTFKDAAAASGTTDRATLYRVTEHMEPLFVEMEKSVDLLEDL